MSTTSPREPMRAPSRRAVLRVGANAAWAVPAIQIAAATPAFATSGTGVPAPTAKLAVKVTSATVTGGTLALKVQVTSSDVAAQSVNLNVTGAVATPVDIGVGDVLLTPTGVTKQFNVTLSSAANTDGI